MDRPDGRHAISAQKPALIFFPLERHLSAQWLLQSIAAVEVQ
jgi:hypothetical protein